MTVAVKHAELVEYRHKDVGVVVKIDYDGGQISLVEAEKGSMPIKYSGKQWVFSNRTIEYMVGWQDIFDAMKNAVKEATALLKAHQESEADKKAELMANVDLAERKAKKKA